MTSLRVLSCAVAVFGALAPGVAAVQAPDVRIAEAAKARDGRALAALIKQRVPVNTALPDGSTALHWAAHYDAADQVDLLLGAGATVDATNDYGVMPLYLAATNGSAAVIERLLKAGASPNAALPTGETVLMAAARTGRPAALAALLAKGAEPNGRQASKGQTALMWAAAEGHLEAARLLVEKGADVSARAASGFTPLMFAAREPSLDLVRMLVERGADVNASAGDGSTPLLVATVRGHVDIAKFLLDKGAKPDGDAAKAGYTPLHWAAGTFESIITYDYPEAPGEWKAAAGIPSRDGKLEMIRLLVARGADLEAPLTKNPPRYGYYLYGIGRGDIMIGGTPFYLATIAVDLEVMKLLLSLGAKSDVRTKSGCTPLMAAAGLGYQDQESRIPQSAYVEATTFVLGLPGVDINAANNDRFTPMHAAAWAGFEQVIQLLADRGAAISPKNRRDETPLDITEGYHFSFFFDRPAAAAVLRKLGAVGGVERGGFLAGQTKKEREEQEKSKPGVKAPAKEPGR
ncbi:MAG: ankyrin repeat domain-containing protein [Vicinamibacterales bacterium]